MANTKDERRFKSVSEIMDAYANDNSTARSRRLDDSSSISKQVADRALTNLKQKMLHSPEK